MFGYSWLAENRKTHSNAKKVSGGVWFLVKSTLYSTYDIMVTESSYEGILWISLSSWVARVCPVNGVDSRSVQGHSLLTLTVNMQNDIHTSVPHNTNSSLEFQTFYVHDIPDSFMTPFFIFACEFLLNCFNLCFQLEYFLIHGSRERNVLFNDTLTTFYLGLYGVRHMVKDHSDSEKGNPLPPHMLLLSINSKGSFICTFPQTG